MRSKRGHSEIIVILDIYDEEEVPYQQYADSRTQFDEQAEAVAAMSSLSLQCLSSPSKRDSLDEGYDPDETLKIVKIDGKTVDILRDSDEEEYFPEEVVETGHDDNDDVIIQQQRAPDFDRWQFMKDPAVLAKDTAHIAGKIAGKSLETEPFLQSPEPKEVRFLDMDTNSGDKEDARSVEQLSSRQMDQDDEVQIPDSLENMDQNTDEPYQPELGRRRSSQGVSNGKRHDRRKSVVQEESTKELKREIEKYASSSKDSDQEVYLELMKKMQNQSSSESLSQQPSKEDLRRKFEKLASSSLDSDQAVYCELMKKLQSQDESELDSDTLVYKELVERQMSYKQKSKDVLPDQKRSSRARHISMQQQATSLQRMEHVAGSSVESNGYYAESGLPVEGGEDEALSGASYHRHGDQT